MEKETNLEHYLHRLKMIVKEKYNSPRMIFEAIQDYVDPQIKHNCIEYTTDILEWMAQEYKGGHPRLRRKEIPQRSNQTIQRRSYSN